MYELGGKGSYLGHLVTVTPNNTEEEKGVDELCIYGLISLVIGSVF